MSSLTSTPPFPSGKAVFSPAELSRTYGWSPAAFWRSTVEGIEIGGTVYRGLAARLFPDLYFITQTGTTLGAILEHFEHLPREEASGLLRSLIDDQVLVSGLMSLPEIFATQERFLEHHRSREVLLYDKTAYEAFKKGQLSRPPPASTQVISLADLEAELPVAVRNRRTHRTFSREQVPFPLFSRLLSVLKQARSEGQARSFYPSTGGLYGIDVYFDVKPRRVEGVSEGLYFYHPPDHRLYRTKPNPVLRPEIHYPQNRAVALSAAFGVVLVFNADVTTPVYGPSAYFLALIEAGIILATLNQVAELSGIGLCSIGLVDFDQASALLGLQPNQKLLHLAAAGVKPDCADLSLDSAATLETASDAAPARREPSTADGAPLHQVPVAELRNFLAGTLPDYMVPSRFVVVDQLPLTPNNKIDREALVKMAGRSLGLGTEFVAPNNQLESKIIAIWRKILPAAEVGAKDNFFDLGGDSIGVAEVQSEIQKQFGLDIPIVRLFRYPTVQALAQHIAEQSVGRGTPGALSPARSEGEGRGEEMPTAPHAPSDRDAEALAWAQSHATDPRAPLILEHLRRRGMPV